MVGTFYAAPEPDAAPFVTVGTLVQPDTVVCLIEAMKVFNRSRPRSPDESRVCSYGTRRR